MIATFELCYDARNATALVYRSIPAGICGPFSQPISCKSHEAAEQIAYDLGYTIDGDWKSHANYDAAALVQVAR